MDRKIYLRGMVGQCWYNFTEGLAYALLYRPIPKELIYEKKVPYGKEKKQYINILHRKDLEGKKKPVFIYIHGGGWISGITEMRNTYISNWAKEGFFTASISYTVAPQKQYPDSVQEIYNAIDFLFDNREKYNLDTDNIVIAGESAGGYYIMYLASAIADKSLLKRAGLTFRHSDEFSVKAMITHCGCYNLESLLDDSKKQSKFPDMKMMATSFLGRSKQEAIKWLKTEEGRLASPKVSEKFPPTFVTWCTRDWLRYEAFDLMKELKRYGVPYGEFKGDGIIGNHAWTIVTIFSKGKECFIKSKDFVMKYID
ncbi:MAG: alpha/beta hydrolase [Acutalibacteraceae bacterium]|nr:alpha/beta hydrolase [Acutalibacteraceae bacterium]